jgi:hypothetical protein
MAKLFPTIDHLDTFRVKPTEGERVLLTFLNHNLDNNYEVFFQPYLNGDNPDIIVMRENSGVMIIEVKDWDLNNYELNDRRNWVLKNVTDRLGRRQVVKSPIQQVFEYKENLYNLHIENLLERRISNPKYLSIVSCCVYFHKAKLEKITSLLTDGFEEKENYLKFLKHFDLFGYDSLTPQAFHAVISKRWLDKKSFFFDNTLYKSFRRYLVPPDHSVEQGKPIIYSEEQMRIISSRSLNQQKIKGVAGSGKTLALAKRAVNAHLRHKGNVLILTFNISLRNYIHDRINEVRENFSWDTFTILHYHQFIRSHNNNVSYVETDDAPTSSLGTTFKTIIIDEVQDYEKDWILAVKQFLDKEGEFVVFGDEKQNIYQRELEEKKPYTSIPGAWNILKRSYRITTEIANLATRFQRTFFTEKYDYDDIEIQRELFETSSVILYHFLEAFDMENLMNIYCNEISTLNVHDNDVCIQCSKVSLIRKIDHEIRIKLRKRTNTMFETEEIYQKLSNEIEDDEKLKKEIEKIRRNKKFNFWMNSGTTKLSTIHSFKGWEIPTLFLLVEKEESDEEDFTTDELIYTAITRCRQNLVIVNIGNQRYHDFFKEAIK